MISVEFVEKALIGSLLNDATPRDDLPWLGIEDFTNPLCRAIWRHLESGNPPKCQPLTDLVEMSEALGRDSQLHQQLRSPAELATLQVQAPEKPAVVEYGRILVDATIRRQIVAMGLRLESLTTGEPEQIVDTVASSLVSLEELDQRWQVSSHQRKQVVDVDLRSTSSAPASNGSSPVAGLRTQTAGADPMDHHLAEQAAIGAAVHDWPPGARAQVFGTVRGYDFTDPRAAATWRAAEYLAEHNTPIDEITVAWQAMRVGGRSGHGLELEELRASRGAALFHEMGAVSLARSTLTRVASRAGTATSRCAQDPSIDLATLIDSALTHHSAVAAAAQRLTGEDCRGASLASIKRRLLDRTRQSPVPTVTARAIDQRLSSYPG